MTSLCMDNGKRTKRFLKSFVTDTITNSYQSYRLRDIDNGVQLYKLRMSNDIRVDIDNRWVFPYSPLLGKTYKAHINVELCSSVKSIKYICNSNEAICMFGFHVHESDPAVIHLAMHLENG
ncbi:unnamed protein product [Euphydryas editha]|uniref:Uncharacterized protein n=1 Tax=Euphydryas editha TaxID=104508 RepID=A0AAU9TIW9_EUPED|nr:unnamed protein product [Euphydryas editha]